MKYSFGKILSIVTLTAFAFPACNNYTPDEKAYIEEIKSIRQAKDDYMKSDPESPFNLKRKVHFEPLKYYSPDPEFVFQTKLYEYAEKDTLTIFGTKGEERKVIRYGYSKIYYDNKEHRLNIYKGISKTGETYYSIWFTDKTTGNETYGVGRYLDFEPENDSNFIYTIDFNLAYNPYCAYNPDYSCAIPTKEDYIDLAIEAGEKKFH